jgi:small-conductance mechanosensitive channel
MDRPAWALDEETAEAYARVVQRFVGVTFRAGLGLFPLLVALETVVLSGATSPLWLAVGALVFGLPVAIEFLSTDRDVEALERFVMGVLVLWLVATLAVSVAGAFGATRPAAERLGLVLVLAGYVLSYLLVYGGWAAWIRAAVGG